jgi:predicted NBD/HSP70 family sugar kinase
LPQQPASYGIWASTDVAALLKGTLHVPVYVENDAAAATMGEMQFGLGKRHQTFFYILITAALGGSLVIDGNHFRGATGRSGELGMLRGKDASGHERQIQTIVSLSALYSRLAAQGIKVSEPHEQAARPSSLPGWRRRSTRCSTR